MDRSSYANSSFVGAALAASFVLLAPSVLAQNKVDVQRADGAQTPMRVYTPKSTSCAPLAIISHGAGGSENGYRYLGEGLQSQGWLAIVVGHKESGPEVLRHEVFTHGLKNGLTQMVTNPTAYRDRFMDIEAADKWATARCKPPYSALLGHSMGAYTVMLEAGAKNNLDLASPASARNFDAFVALSPSGPGQEFPADAWADIHKPMLIITGTKDRALNGGWQSRTIPYQNLPSGCHWLGVVEDATHMNFAGIGIGAEKADSLTLSLIYSFLHGARSGSCTLPPNTSDITVQAK